MRVQLLFPTCCVVQSLAKTIFGVFVILREEEGGGICFTSSTECITDFGQDNFGMLLHPFMDALTAVS